MAKKTKEEIYTVTEKRPVSEEIYCDRCGRLIFRRNIKEPEKNRPQVELLELTTGHHDWGNDSCESIDHKTLCSRECALLEFSDYLDRSLGHLNSEYFEIAHARHRVEFVGDAGHVISRL